MTVRRESSEHAPTPVHLNPVLSSEGGGVVPRTNSNVQSSHRLTQIKTTTLSSTNSEEIISHSDQTPITTQITSNENNYILNFIHNTNSVNKKCLNEIDEKSEVKRNRETDKDLDFDFFETKKSNLIINFDELTAKYNEQCLKIFKMNDELIILKIKLIIF